MDSDDEDDDNDSTDGDDNESSQANGKVQHESVSAADLALLVGEKDGKRHFNMSKVATTEKLSKTQMRKKRKLAAKMAKKDTGTEQEEEMDDFVMDVNDPRFSALYTSGQYNLDMTEPAFKKTKGMDALIAEKLKRRGGGQNGEDPRATNGSDKHEKSTPKIRPEISSLAKSVKAKIGASEKKKLQKWCVFDFHYFLMFFLCFFFNKTSFSSSSFSSSSLQLNSDKNQLVVSAREIKNNSNILASKEGGKIALQVSHTAYHINRSLGSMAN